MKEAPKIFESEFQLCSILWKNEPISSGKLVQLCNELLGWKPTTTYTVIKRLSQRGVLINENSVIHSLYSKEEVQRSEINDLIERRFFGSVSMFINSFVQSENLSDDDFEKLIEMIEKYKNRK